MKVFYRFFLLCLLCLGSLPTQARDEVTLFTDISAIEVEPTRRAMLREFVIPLDLDSIAEDTTKISFRIPEAPEEITLNLRSFKRAEV